MTDRAWLALGRIPGLGPIRQRALLERFGAVDRCFQTGASALQGLGLQAAQIA
ncbi:DNA-protecting protein DprA, partial [Acidithiobacillus ferridurans]|nr:DNA-protecting protein DprA [Acidithiobacillus ferridurans]